MTLNRYYSEEEAIQRDFNVITTEEYKRLVEEGAVFVDKKTLMELGILEEFDEPNIYVNSWAKPSKPILPLYNIENKVRIFRDKWKELIREGIVYPDFVEGKKIPLINEGTSYQVNLEEYITDERLVGYWTGDKSRHCYPSPVYYLGDILQQNVEFSSFVLRSYFNPEKS